MNKADDKPFRVESWTQIIVRGPESFRYPVGDDSEGAKLADILNQTYTWAFLDGKQAMRAELLQEKDMKWCKEKM